jgi:DNA-binding PadR family transcriptional regulator
MPADVLGEFEQVVLLAVLCAARATQDAYGVNVHAEICDRLRRPVTRGAVYMTLDRLENKGLLTSYLTDPSPERGGRAKRCYRVTRRARVALHESRRGLLRLWEALVEE